MAIFIVNQIIVDKTEVTQFPTTHNIMMASIIRQVIAKNKEEAIGKFVLATADIKAEKKLQIECIPLENLTSVE